ncbi:glycosyltransferase family 2 protein [Tatumella ptyseos]|uniref:glycosyltransferase family 2 protein n=1 Tax=Tatumella ptyseos TaxID=82987 RepID=UPI0026F276B0|nr:glycosyltransferase family 2 protein [Tatumella ptyseos]WKX27168.1 glycosyltransferase [Tatumella ptyseos]
MKVSVIVPVYNVESYVEDCIDSLINQDFDSYEVIIVDDGSQDQSINLISRMIQRNDNFKIVKKVNGGLSSARNYGMNYIKGEFFTFVDSDDILDVNFLKRTYNSIGDADLCCTGYNEISESGNYIKTTINNFDIDKQYENIVEAIDFIPNAWGKLYKKSSFIEIKYPEGMLFEDFAISYEVFFNKKIIFLDDPLYNYRIRAGSIMREFNDKVISHKMLILERMKKFLIRNKIFNKYKFNYIDSYNFHGVFVTSCMIMNQRPENAYNIIRAFKKSLDKKNFNIKNILLSKKLKLNVKVFLIILSFSCRGAFLLKNAQHILKSFRKGKYEK